MKITSKVRYLRLRAGALRQRLRQRHGVKGRPARVAMKFLKRIPHTKSLGAENVRHELEEMRHA
eukprot:5586613-Pleurochrysis_carterae.AAC.1